MATAATITAQPVPFGVKQQSIQRPVFDPIVLSAKLAALQTNDVFYAQQQPTRNADAAAKRRSYVPRNAAQQFHNTATPMGSGNNEQAIKRARSTAERQKPMYMADGKPCVNPKRLQAALHIGMTDHEAAAAVPEVPRGYISAADRRREQIQQASPPSGAAAGTGVHRATSNATAYKPGDAAARRNIASKRSSLPPTQPQGKLIAVKHGFHTTYERESTIQTESVPHFNGASASWQATSDHPAHPQRPSIKASDRPNWTQASQCGEDMHHLLGNWKRHHKRPEAVDESAEESQQEPLQRHKSLGAAPENLISDAVEKIRREEKASRRRSVMGFFKRL
ncbi:hypothetical protein LTR86_007386 [Recurvomyces mirabilis]|nr:hypothetical protein LTR86_007386 [Recurvomyces mirabilis]